MPLHKRNIRDTDTRRCEETSRRNPPQCNVVFNSVRTRVAFCNTTPRALDEELVIIQSLALYLHVIK